MYLQQVVLDPTLWAFNWKPSAVKPVSSLSKMQSIWVFFLAGKKAIGMKAEQEIDIISWLKKNQEKNK